MSVMADIRSVHKRFGPLEVGTTMVIVSHETGFAREAADTVVFTADGRIVEAGPPVLDAPREERTRTFPSQVL